MIDFGVLMLYTAVATLKIILMQQFAPGKTKNYENPKSGPLPGVAHFPALYSILCWNAIICCKYDKSSRKTVLDGGSGHVHVRLSCIEDSEPSLSILGFVRLHARCC